MLPIDMQKALKNPAAVFVSPEAVQTHDRLQLWEKIKILRRWEDEAADAATFDEGGMPDGDTTMLHRVVRAIESLSAEAR